MPRFIANNTLDTRNLFFFREQYKDTVLQDDRNLDLWHSQRQLYGKIDREWNFVLPKDECLSYLDDEFKLRALNFVVDAFKDFRSAFLRAVISKRLSLQSNIRKLEAKKAYINSNYLYAAHIEKLFETFHDVYLSGLDSDQKIKDFQGYLNGFTSYISIFGKYSPANFSSFLGSLLCPLYGSGLFIEIDFKDHSDDSAKERFYLNDDNFEFYRNLALKYGFLVNKNAPWQLVFNISSKFAEKYMREYGIVSDKKSPSDVFKKCYEKAIFEDVALLNSIMMEKYEIYARENPEYSKFSYVSGEGVCDQFFVNIVNLNSNVKSKPFEFWLRYYVRLKCAEFNMNFSETKKQRIIATTMNLYRTRRIGAVLEYINNIFKRHLIRNTNTIVSQF